MKRKLSIVMAVLMLTLGLLWMLIPCRSQKTQLLHFTIGPVFYTNDTAMCSVVVSNASGVQLFLLGGGTPTSYLLVEFFTKGVRIENELSDSSVHSLESQIMSVNEIRREEVKIPQRADAFRVGLRRQKFSWDRRVYRKVHSTPLENVFGRLLRWHINVELTNSNPLQAEFTDVFPLRAGVTH